MPQIRLTKYKELAESSPSPVIIYDRDRPSFVSPFLTKKKMPVSKAVNSPWMPVQIKNATKYLVLRLPTQVPTQGQ